MVPACLLALFVFGCAALKAQSVSAIDPAITVTPSGGGTTAAATAPVLSGISGGGTVELGQPVTLTVIFSGQVTLTDYSYQWRKGTNDISGATSNTFAISAAAAADAGSYAVTVTNSAGSSVASTSLTVKALAAPVITAPPRATIASVGQGVTFGFSATGSYPRTYQWFKDGAALSGATNTTFSITAVTTTDAGSYSVQVSNSQGADTSAPASLTVNAAIAPVIYSYSPSDVTVTAGGQASLTVSLSAGSAPFTFQWYKNGTAVAATTTTQLFFNAVALTDAGKYYVVVSNPAGSATSREATLTVTPPTPVSIYSQPQNQTIYQGQTLQLYVSAGGSSPITYQWLKNGTAIPNATSSSFSIQSAALSDSGSYSAVVTNPAGSVTSATATVTVNPPVAPTITTQPTSQNVPYGGSINLNVQASGSPPLTFAWSKDGSALGNGNSSNYSFSSATAAQSGSYTVTVSNSAGAVTSNAATVTVAAPVVPIITSQPAAQQVAVGLQASFTVSFSSTGAGALTLQWLKNGGLIPGATSSSYTINSVRDTDAGSYTVVITGPAGSVTSAAAALTVLPPAPPSVQWSSYYVTTVALGGNASLSAVGYSNPGGTPPFTYQWSKNGVPISGATNGTLDFRAVTASDYATYTVTISNEGGVITSPGMRLRPQVYTSNSTSSQPWLDVAQLGDTVYFLATVPSRIERYDLAGERWLPTTLLGATQVPTSFAVAAEGVYVAYGRSIARRSLDLATETAIVNGTVDITQMFVYGPYLYYNSSNTGQWVSNNYSTLNRSTLQSGPSATIGYYGNPRQVALAPSIGKGFLCTLGLSPSDIAMFTFASNGSAPGATDSPYHGTMPIGDRAIVLPGDQYVTDTSGTVYRTSDLTYVGSFGEAFNDLAFLSDGTPVVMRGLRLTTTRTDNFVEIGRAALAQPALRLFARGTSVFAFGAANGTTPYSAAKVTLDSFAPVAPPAGSLPPANRYSVDDAFLGSNNIVHIFSRTLQGFVRWNPATRTFLPTLPLRDAPSIVFHQPGNPRALLYYPDGVITEMPLATGATERTLANIGQYVRAMVDLGDMFSVNFAEWQDSGDDRILLGVPGGPKFINTSLYEGTGYAWLSGPRRLYSAPAFSSGALQYEVISSAGALASNAPTSTNSVATPPLRFNADGSLLATMNGRVFTGDLGAVGVLANNITDAAWLGNTLYSIRARNGQTEIQRWAPITYLLSSFASVPGTPVRILRLSDSQLLLVTSNAGFLTLTLVNPDLSVVAPPGLGAFAGVYFAKISGAANSGDVGVYVRSDGTGVALINLPGTRTSIVATGFSINADGSFVGTGHDLASGASRTIYGLLAADGSVSGAIPTLGLTYSGTRAAGAGMSGYFPTLAVNGRNGAAYAIVGPDGRALVVAATTTTVDGAMGSIDTAGNMSATGSSSATFSVSFDAVSGSSSVTTTSGSATVTFAGLRDGATSTARLGNISTRGMAGTADNALIAGFVVSGSAPRPVLLRAIGPALASFGVSGSLAAPHLSLFRGSGSIGTSDSWGANGNSSAIVAAGARVGAFALAPASADAALLVTLDPGAYTASISGANGATGIALVEVYDVGDPAPATGPRLINIATRGTAGAGDNALIAGIVITGNTPKRVLVRGVGPTLGTFGVAGTLADPVLTILSGSKTLLANDDWGLQTDGVTASDISTTTASLGAFALGASSKDAAVLTTLQPGNYTAQVTGKGAASGVALIEVYEVSN